MKKVLSLALALSIVVFGSSLAASAAEISLATDNLGRGAGDSTVVANDDGSITTATSNISFYLPEAVKAGETVTVTMKGSSDGDFRVWLIDVNEVTNSNIYQMSQNDFTSGDFDKTFDLTATAEATEIFFKAPSWDAKINNLTISELTVTSKEGEEVVADDEAEEADAVEADVVEAEATELPKTGETSNAVLYMALMGLAAVGIVVSKKKLVKE
ncbi:LPXTG cell wall anchor domain-containing protein [Mobilitalea sibirica]|uniref:LPXTG cell wall anchor domain-containing protein n=1 Tax=Mobilitalea sibirica TaxID=1462919 RepID=A0A8J7KVA6_9FIRM|nr:LPXTG cell wall anchor domain-containing protein [Mobilitalea sibirica]MBH1939925.1 LPXTG cell wall anchor domain-containing protein [Mobilitalea sibirica]